MDYVAANHTPPAVASMSLGGGVSEALNNAVEGLVKNGVTVVVAAGNDDNDACLYSPASAQKVCTHWLIDTIYCVWPSIDETTV